MEGQGVLEYSNNDQFVGNFVNNKRQDGFGTMIYANGERYEGEWKDEIQHGQGAPPHPCVSHSHPDL